MAEFLFSGFQAGLSFLSSCIYLLRAKIVDMCHTVHGFVQNDFK